MLVLDAGDALVSVISGGATLGDTTQGRAVVAAMNLLRYDAMAVGPKELSLGFAVLRERSDEADFPFLSANVAGRGRDGPAFDPYAFVDVGDHQLAILGLTRPLSDDESASLGDLALGPAPLADFVIGDARAAAAEFVPELRRRADVVIVLTNLGQPDALALAAEVGGIDLVVAARADDADAEPTRAAIRGTPVLSAESPTPYHTGRRVGRLLAALAPDRQLRIVQWESVWMDKTLEDEPRMAELLVRLEP